MGKIDRTVDINIGGKPRKLKYTIGSLEELEANLPNRNVFEFAGRGSATLSELVTATWIGLKAYDKKLSKLTVKDWVAEYIPETDNGDLYGRITAALGLSGLFGKDVSVFKKIVEELDQKNRDESEEITEDSEEMGKY